MCKAVDEIVGSTLRIWSSSTTLHQRAAPSRGLLSSVASLSPKCAVRRWAHMLGFGGHFLTKSRIYSITFNLLRQQRIAYRRTVTTGPDIEDLAPELETTLVVNFLQFVGAGWHTTGDALLANSSAALAREQHHVIAQDVAAFAAHVA